MAEAGGGGGGGGWGGGARAGKWEVERWQSKGERWGGGEGGDVDDPIYRWKGHVYLY